MEMHRKRQFLILFSVIMGAIFALTGCARAASPAPVPTPGGPGGGTVINSDSVVTAKIQAIRQETSGYPWELDVLIQDSVDVGTLPNPTKDSIGKVVTAKTDQDMSPFKVNDVVTARVKYVGDVPRPGISLYIYDIALQEPPTGGPNY